MFCSSCGAQVPDGSKFCPRCGAKCDTPVMTPYNVNMAAPVTPMAAPGAPMAAWAPKKTSGKKPVIIGIIAAVALVAIAVIAAKLLIKPAIDLNKYMIINFDGYDTLGHANAEFNIEKFKADYGKELNKKLKDQKSKYKDEDDLKALENDEDLQEALLNLIFWDEDKGAEALIDTFVRGEVDQQVFLTNGDVINYRWDVDSATAEKVFGYKLKHEDIKITVKGLEEVETFDPYEGLEVGFEGTNGQGQAYIKTQSTSSYAEDLLYTFDKNGGLSNDEKVEVKVTLQNGDDSPEAFLEELGAVPDLTSKGYYVSGLSDSQQPKEPSSEPESEPSSEASSEPAQDDEDEYDHIPTEGQIFPDSSFEIIDPALIKELSDEDLRSAINELYARAGYIFKDEELNKFYSSLDWYEPRINSSDFTMDDFNTIERENVEALQKERDSRK